MRILKLRFQNLNSLYGVWSIDWTDPVYRANGIFAVTGPTGSGKTTILDAICLALYGRTPRLKRISGNENEILSRRAGACYSEVTFETGGKRYRCHWSQSRARNSAEGNLQPAAQELVDEVTGHVLASGLTKVAKAIEDVTGVNFSQFCQSMMLAQGAFAAFLRADPKDRAPILEQITGTAIYKKISIQVHKKFCELNKEIDALHERLDGINVMTCEERAEVTESLRQQNEVSKRLDKEIALLQEKIRWREDLEKWEDEEQKLALKRAEWKEQMTQFQPDRKRLEAALRALTLEGTYATLTSQRVTRDQRRQNREEAEKKLPEEEKRLTENSVKQNNARIQYDASRKERHDSAPNIKRTRELDIQITERSKNICEKEKEQKGLLASLQKLTAEHEADERKKTESEQTRYQLLRQQEKASADEKLPELLGEWKGLLARRKKELNERKQRETQKNDLRLKRDKLCQCLEEKRHEMADAHSSIRRFCDQLETEGALSKRLFTAARRRLRPGDPCPICGATTRCSSPSDEMVDETPDADEAKWRSEDDNDWAQIHGDYAALMESLAEKQRIFSETQSDFRSCCEKLEETQKEIDKENEELQTLERELDDAFRVYDEEPTWRNDVNALIERLTTRINQWNRRVKQITELNEVITAINAAANIRSKRMTDEIEKKVEFEKTLAEDRERLDLLTREREILFGKKNPDDEEKRLLRAEADTEKADRDARDQYEASQKRVEELNSEIKRLALEITQYESSCREIENEFGERLKALDFSDETVFQNARLLETERLALESRAKWLHDENMNLQALERTNTERLKAEREKKRTEESLGELRPQKEARRSEYAESQQRVGGLQARLEADRKKSEEHRRLIERRDKLTVEIAPWRRLHELIGSHDGEKYCRMAQSINLEMLTALANERLEKMTDRYRLVPDDDKEKPLNLKVVDYEQAGAIRSIQNLSGGESFLVSLALALGLARMAGGKTRIDSLFLDEGFGTLDEETAEVALNTLASLESEGKLIGVISHMPLLKERVPVQIEVTPLSCGRSRIRGPGCS